MEESLGRGNAGRGQKGAAGFQNERQGGESWRHFKDVFHLSLPDPDSYSPLVLAYIGDAVYEMLIRTITVAHGNMQVNKMHRHDTGLLKASAQAEMIRLLEGNLTGEEETVYKRGRNAKSLSGAKNATVIDYRMATGFEALLGYLYLREDFDRITDLVALGLERLGEPVCRGGEGEKEE